MSAAVWVAFWLALFVVGFRWARRPVAGPRVVEWEQDHNQPESK